MTPAVDENPETQPVDLAAIADNLEPGPDGIWVSRTHSPISYPEEGNLNCLALEAGSFWFKHRNRCIQAVLRRCPPPGPVFDIGGGNGYVTVGLEEAGFDAVLVEPGWQGVQNARGRGVKHLVCAALEDAGFHAGSLPAVGLFDVLEHIAGERDFLSEIHHLLVPGGRLYLTVPAFQALWSTEDDYAGHYRRYTLAGLEKMLRESGFTVGFATYIFWMLPLPILLMRAIPSRLGLHKPDDWDRYQQEHSSSDGLAGTVLERLLLWELGQISQGRRVPLGGSCLVSARMAPK